MNLPGSRKLEGIEIDLKPQPGIEPGNHIGFEIEIPSWVRRIKEKGERR